MRSSVLALVLLVIPTIVYSHGVLSCPTARGGMSLGNGDKLKGSLSNNLPNDAEMNSCRDTAVGPVQATFTAGQTITITWDTTITHASDPGVRIAVAYDNKTNFNDNVLAKNLQIGSDGTHTADVTLPAGKTSNNAVIQWIWASSQDGGYYLGCADVKIQTATSPAYKCDPSKILPAPTPSASGNGSGSGQTNSESASSRVQIVFGLVAACLVALF